MRSISIFARSALARSAFACLPRWGPLIGALSPAILGTAVISPIAPQDPGTFRLWAAQTGPNQVSLAWDSVPGTREYRIYLGDPSAPGTLQGRPASALGAGATSAVITGLQRVVKGITLVAMDANGRVLRQESFNPVVPATSFPAPAPPSGLTAEAPSASEVTVSWDPVPGATAYFIGRAVSSSGFKPACALCSTEPRYVDRSVTAGQPHTYTIAAILPSGVSTRVNSNTVTPGQASEAASTPPVQSTGTTITTGTATTGTATSTTTTGTAPTGTAGTTADTTSTSTTGSSVPAVAVASPTNVVASVAGPGAVRLTWQPSTSPGVTGYEIVREGLGDLPGWRKTVPPTSTRYDDTAFQARWYPHDPWWVNYSIAAVTASGKSIFTNAAQIVVPPAPPICQLSYHRADNMWVAFGTPYGPLGTEYISLETDQIKSLSTDWKYEKQRNDGWNYYGSHLRVATNIASGRIRLLIRFAEGLVTKEEWVELPPNTRKEFQADLKQVSCQG